MGDCEHSWVPFRGSGIKKCFRCGGREPLAVGEEVSYEPDWVVHKHVWESTTALNYRRCRRCVQVERLVDGVWGVMEQQTPRRRKRGKSGMEQLGLFEQGQQYDRREGGWV